MSGWRTPEDSHHSCSIDVGFESFVKSNSVLIKFQTVEARMSVPHKQLLSAMLIACVATSVSGFKLRNPGTTKPVAAIAPELVLVCSGAKGALNPCGGTQTIDANSAGLPVVFTLSNTSSAFVEGGIQCSRTGAVASCSIATGAYELSGHQSMTDTLYFTAGQTGGAGSVTVATGGQIGALSSVISVTVTPLSPCLPADSFSVYMLARLRDIATAATPPQSTIRLAAQLQQLELPTSVYQVTLGQTCSAAARAFDSLETAVSASRHNPNRRVYVFWYLNFPGPRYLIADPTVRNGEWTPLKVFSDSFVLVGNVPM